MSEGEGPSIEHLEWLIPARGKNNATALKLLSLFKREPIKKIPNSVRARQLVAIAFSLWRAAFLADRKGKIKGLPERKLADAEQFLRKILVDNQIGFAQDRQWREWSFQYYLDDAYSRLANLEDDWDGLDLGSLHPTKGQRTPRYSWDLLHDAFAKAVARLEDDLNASGSD
jgi:hypothetical protein